MAQEYYDLESSGQEIDEAVQKIKNLSDDLKGDSAYEIAVKNGFEGTEQEWLNSITTIVEGENILNRSVIGVSGTLARKAISGSTWTTIEFIPVMGDISTINSFGEWICPNDGTYTIFVNFGTLRAGVSASGVNLRLTLNNLSDMNDLDSIIGQIMAVASGHIPSLIITRNFIKNDRVSFHVKSSAININDYPVVSNFTIIQNTSINLNTQDLYKKWKEQDPSRENITFDDWMKSELSSKSNYDLWLEAGHTGTIDDYLEWMIRFIGKTPYVPDYSNMESINRITSSGGTWIVDRDGFVVCNSYGATTTLYQILINNKVMATTPNDGGNSYYTPVHGTFSVATGDIVKIFGQNTSCYYIPPREISVDADNIEEIIQQMVDEKFKDFDIADSIISVNGTMPNFEFSGDLMYKLKFIPLEGSIKDIDSNGDWVCPKDGIYSINVNIGTFDRATPGAWLFFIKNGLGDPSIDETIGTSYMAGVLTLSCNATVRLLKGDIIASWLNAINTNMIGKPSFTIILNTSIDITVWNAYETWQSLDPENNTTSFNEWVEDKLRDSVLFGAPIGFTIPMMRNDDIVVDSDGVWIKANGVIYDPEEYPATEKLKGFEATPIARMTSDTTPEPFIATLSNWDGDPVHRPYHVFDKFFTDKRVIDENESYFGAPAPGPCVLTVDLSDRYADILNAISMYPITLSGEGYMVSASPKNFTIQASNNNSSWTTLLTKTNVSNWTIDGLKFEFNNSTKYRYYRINMTASNGHHYYHLKEIKLHGTLFHRSPNLPMINEMYQYIKIKQRILTNIDKQIELSNLISKDNDNALGLGTDEKFFVKKVTEQESEKEYVPLGLPVGYVATMAQTDEFVKADDGVWIRANGVYYDINEYPYAPKLVGFEDTSLPLMTSNTTPEPFVISSTNTIFEPYLAFDGIERPPEWANDSYAAAFPCILTIDLSNAYADILYSMTIIPAIDEGHGIGATPKNFSIQGSNNGTSWTTLLSKSNITNWIPGGQTFEFENDTKYRYYRLNISAGNGHVNLHMKQIKIKGKLFHRSACLPQIDGMYQYIKIKQGLSFEPSEPQEKDLLLGIQQEGIPIGNVKKLNFSDMLKLNVVDDTANIDISVKAPILMTSPIGTTIQAMWTDSKVIFNGGVWLRLNGQKFSGEEYPQLINMAGIEGISDPLNPAMTSNTAPSGYSASSTSNMTGHLAWHGFAKKPDNFWVSAATGFNKTTGIGSQELRLKLNATKKLGWYIIRSRGDGADEIDFPMNFTIWGSPTTATGGTEWVLLDTRTNISTPFNQDGSPAYAPIAFQIPNADDNPEYLHYKIQTTQIKPDNNGYVSIGAFELYAPTSEYILPAILPTTQGLNTYVYAKDLTSQIIADIDYIAAMMGVNLNV